MKDRKCFDCGGPHLARDCPTKGSRGPVKAIEDGLVAAMQPFMGMVSEPEPASRRPRPRGVTLGDFPVRHVPTKIKNMFKVLESDDASTPTSLTAPSGLTHSAAIHIGNGLSSPLSSLSSISKAAATALLPPKPQSDDEIMNEAIAENLATALLPPKPHAAARPPRSRGGLRASRATCCQGCTPSVLQVPAQCGRDCSDGACGKPASGLVMPGTAPTRSGEDARVASGLSYVPGRASPPVCSRPSTHSMQDGYRGVEFEEDRHGDEVQRGVTGAIGVLSVEPAGETPANEPFPLLSSDMLEEIIRRELDSAAQIITDEEELDKKLSLVWPRC